MSRAATHPPRRERRAREPRPDRRRGAAGGRQLTSSLTGPAVIGHRGAPGYRPEHTLGGYRLAVAQGVDAVEPDLVASKDGVLVVRHENEISTTTDVASRPEFAGRRVTKEVDGREVTGWFTEDFTWAELSTLRALERLPRLRPGSAAFDGRERLIRFADLLRMLGGLETVVGVVAEFKHPTYFRSLGLPLEDLFVDEVADAAPGPDRLMVECFERSLLDRLRQAGVQARRVYLMEATGTAPDLVASGRPAPTYAEELEQLETVTGIDGISVDKRLLLDPELPGHRDVVERAHALGLQVLCWTFRPENRFLAPRFRTGPDAGFGDWRAELTALEAAGVDGLFADHPDLARRGAD